MAQRITTWLIDHLDGEYEVAETVAFGLDGAAYEIDLSDGHAAEFRDAVAAYVGAARRAGGRPTAAVKPQRRPATNAKSGGGAGPGRGPCVGAETATL